MALTQLQKLELNKRVDKIFCAPSNTPIKGHPLEIAFVADISGNIQEIDNSIKDAVTALKSHDKLFQNMRSNMVYWGSSISTKVMPMSFIQMGKAFEASEDNIGEIVDKSRNFDQLCGYLKLYHARCRAILIFIDCTYEELEKQQYFVLDTAKAIENLNPFLKYRILLITKDKMEPASALMMKLIRGSI